MSSSSPAFRSYPLKLEKEKEIGSGTYGVVWAVRDTETGKKAALKIMPDVFNCQVACIRALRELQVMHEFHHDNLLSSLAILPPSLPLSDSEVSIMSELMDSDLRRVIRTARTLGEDHIKLVTYQILRGVKYLHSADIIHRDLQPKNILVNRNCQVKIADFGLARAVVQDQNRQMTMGVITQYYRPPELLAGCIHYGVEIDMWSVGCIFAELLCRKILFEAADIPSQLEMITDLLGTPAAEDVDQIETPSARSSLLSAAKPSTLNRLHSLSSNATPEAVEMLGQMLQYSPEKRLTATQALHLPYLERGRAHYHSSLCTGCKQVDGGEMVYCQGGLEPSSLKKFDTKLERCMVNLKMANSVLVNYMIFSKQ